MRSAAEVWRARAAWGEAVRPSDRVRFLEAHPDAALSGVWLATEPGQAPRRALDDFLGRLRFVEPRLDGHALRALGLPPGPLYGRILDDLRNGWLDGEITNESEERQRLTTLLEAPGTSMPDAGP
jgi:tRNA nucleotidyltransferase (CCA-adding enzyme)